MPPMTTGRTSDFDPDQYRMSVGDHLEELRRRVMFALVGLIVAFIFCLIFADRVIAIFCLPLIRELRDAGLNTQFIFTQMTDPFMVYLKIAMISAAVLASPWIFWQLWQFVAAGLYPHERKYVTRYLPLSLGLLVAGMLLVYFVILKFALRFLILFGIGLRLPVGLAPPEVLVPPGDVPAVVSLVDVLAGDPPQPQLGQVWFNTVEQRLKIRLADSVRTLAFMSENLMAPMPTLPEYISLVLMLLLAFGLSFQLPIVVMVLGRVGIVEIEAMKAGRKYVYFALAIASAVVTPAEPFSMVGMMLPLIVLYEFGIWLAGRGGRS
jgi:sec-independent protein translocase protein TatC